MTDPTSRGEAFDVGILNSVYDPDVRRALRALHQHYEAALARQQTQFEALLEMILEKHVGSIGEFKRHLLRLQQKDVRGLRLHEQIASAAASAAASSARPHAH